MEYHTKVIPHNEQRYDTVGDYFFSDDEKHCYISVSDSGDDDYNNAVAIHELYEVMQLLRKHSPKEIQSIVDAFDIEYEKNRPEGNDEEPGDDPRAPYHTEHCGATAVERMYIASTGKNWKTYNDKLLSLEYGK